MCHYLQHPQGRRMAAPARLWGDILKGLGEGYGDSNRSSEDTYPSPAAGRRVRARLAVINKTGLIPISACRHSSPQGDPLPCPPRSLSPGRTTGSYHQRRLWEGVTSGHSVLPRFLEPPRQFTTPSLVRSPSSSAQFLPLNLIFWFLSKCPLELLKDLDDKPFYWYFSSLFKIFADYRINSACF